MRKAILFLVLILGCFILFFCDLFFGSVDIPAQVAGKILLGKETAHPMHANILLEFRLPKAITALLTGMALSVSGLLMQTLFRNPLAGPYVLGISSGASLGVAIYIMLSTALGISFFLPSGWGYAIASITGALLVLLLVVLTSLRVRDSVSLLIVGMMFGSITSAFVGVLQSISDPDSLKLFIHWTLGSLSSVSRAQLQVLIPLILIGLLLAVALQKNLDALLLGENYARGVGVSVFRTRLLIILATSLLAGAATAFTGPIGFIGTAVPHIARGIFKTSRHAVIMPASILCGAGLLLLCDIISQLPDSGYVLPINAISALFGAPIIIWIIMGSRNGKTMI
jgi:iron complex transport system permease protein